jgi:hypothetical protein
MYQYMYQYQQKQLGYSYYKNVKGINWEKL